MSQLVCNQGHRWDADAASACPVCGSAPLSETVTLPPPVSEPTAASVRPEADGYELLEELGRGGMGVVYKARQRSLNRIVALKMILSGSHAGAAELARFRAEAEAVAALQHPNIVQIYEVGEQDGHAYFSLEYVGGGNLAQRLDGKPVPAGEAAVLVETLARAVHAAHQKGIVHRDLKPANVLLQTTEATEDAERKGQKNIEKRAKKDRDKLELLPHKLSSSVSSVFSVASHLPKITDFGLAKRIDAEQGHTQSGSIVGTPSYMAPEQAGGRSKEIGPATDVYALGAILYEMLSGRPPFRADTPLDTLLLVVGEEPVPPSRLRPKLPRDLETICLKCLEKEPRKRYAGADELADDLRHFLANEPIRARPVGVLGGLAKWARRRPAVAALGAVSALIAVIGLSGVLWQWRQTEDQRRQTVAALRDAETNLYFNHIALADREWQANNVARARQLLDDCPPRLRRWEWGHLVGRCRTDRWTLCKASASVEAVVFSADGRRLAVATADGTVQVWNAETRRQLYAFHAHMGTVNGIAFSPDGTRLATAGDDAAVRLWDAATGSALTTLSGHKKAAKDVAFSPDGTRLATAGGDGTVLLWDGTGKRLLTLPTQPDSVNAIAFSPDGKRLATGSGDLFAGRPGTVMLWDAATGKGALTFKGNFGPVLSVAYSPDGRRVAAACNFTDAKVWNAQNGEEEFVLYGHTNLIAGITYSRDGRYLATASWDQSAKVWDARTGRDFWTQRGHLGKVQAVAFRPDGGLLATGGEDMTVKLWPEGEGQDALSLRLHAWSVSCVVFAPNGRHCASGGHDGSIKVWDAATGRETVMPRGHKLPVVSLAFSPDGSLLATSCGDPLNPMKNGEATVWDAATGREVCTLRGQAGGVGSVVFSPDGATVATCGYDGGVRLWGATNGQLQTELRGTPGPAFQLAYSPDGRRLAAARLSQCVSVWDLATGAEVLVLRGRGDPFWSVAFSADGNVLAGGSGNFSPPRGEVLLWDAATGKEMVALKGHTSIIWGVAFHPDGSRLATAGEDGTVRIWETSSGREVLTLRGRFGGFTSATFSADGRKLAASGRDRSVRVWDAPPDSE